jgi:futalosine hydrolase
MRILLTASTEMELEPMTDLGGQVDMLASGVGVPATVFSLTRLLTNQKYDLVIQVGLAGSFRSDLPPGEVVLLSSDVFADLGLEEKGQFIPLFQTSLVDAGAVNKVSGVMENLHAYLPIFSLRKVKGITVNKVTDDNGQNEFFQTLYDAEVETMEGAALHWVCLQFNIPFLQLRGVSNQVGDRDKANWKIEESLRQIALRLREILKFLQTV